jgi:hypothetical protein
MKYKITYINIIVTVLFPSSLSLSGTPENQTFDDKRHNDLINVKETEWTILNSCTLLVDCRRRTNVMIIA